MGIYVISKDVLFKLLQEELPDAYDFETEVIQGAVSLGMKVCTLITLTDLTCFINFPLILDRPTNRKFVYVLIF